MSNLVRRIFISHYSAEAALAKCFASWLESLSSKTKCFCSSRPEDIAPGLEWFQEICAQARQADLCIILVSPFSAANAWLHFESGLTYGAGTSLGMNIPVLGKWLADRNRRRVVPAVYGGLAFKHVPPNLQAFQCSDLTNPERLHALVTHHRLADGGWSPDALYANFTKSLTGGASRLLNFGEPGGHMEGPFAAEKSVSPVSLSHADVSHLSIARHTADGEVRAVRVRFVPRKHTYIQTWKFGITLYEAGSAEPRVFQFHAGRHDALDTWTLYYLPPPSHNYIGVPATIGADEEHELQLWLTPDQKAMCVWRESSTRKGAIANDRGKYLWKLAKDTWTEVRLEGWNEGQQFQIDITSYEIDRKP